MTTNTFDRERGRRRERSGGRIVPLRVTTKGLIPSPMPLPYSSDHEDLIRSISFARPPLDRAAPRLASQSVLLTAQKGHVVDDDEGAGATSSPIDLIIATKIPPEAPYHCQDQARYGTMVGFRCGIPFEFDCRQKVPQFT